MIWIAPLGKDTNNAALEKRLWDAADQFCANLDFKAQEYSAPVLGLIFHSACASGGRPTAPTGSAA
jgi:type I restriction enzyme M protein